MDYAKLTKDLRMNMLEMAGNGASAHFGGSFSCIDFLSVLFYEYVLGRAWRLVYSKGHAEVALYSLLGQAKMIEPDRGLKQFQSLLQGHPSRHWIPALTYSAGSLGQGLSFALGMAVCGYQDGFHVAAVLGDGELQEGQVWEAAICAARHHTENLTVFVDCNHMQLTGRIPVLSDLQRLSSIWAAMGWHTRVIHGHDFEEIQDALTWSTLLHDKPKIIFADTVKGKGIRFMENDPAFHCSCLTREELQAAKQELLS